MTRSSAALVLVILASQSAGAADHWPRFRGPEARGIADGANLPDTWSATENVTWKTELPGRGWSSPIVWGDRIVVTTCVNTGTSEEPKKGLYFGGDRTEPPKSEHQWKVMCLDLATGSVRWERTVHQGVPEKSIHIKNSYASETPVTDGEHIYALFGNVGLYCLTMDGDLVWSKDFAARETRHSWGTAASPVLHEDRLYIVNDNDEQSVLMALDKRSGQEVWHVERDERSNWATPYVWENKLRTEIITAGTGRTRSYSLDGDLLYEFGGASGITIATPYAAHGLLYVSSGYIMDRNKPVWALRPGAAGDITVTEEAPPDEAIAWLQKQAAPYNPTTIVYGDQLYVLLDRGLVASYNALTGEPIYDRQRLPRGQAFTASPWAADGKLYFLNEYGTTFVVKAGPEFELLQTNTLAEDDMCMATPAIAGDKLLIRTAARLYCIER